MKQFTLVAAIQEDGGVGDVETQPSTNTAQCFGEQFRDLHLPPLPEEFGSLPVFFEMHLDG